MKTSKIDLSITVFNSRSMGEDMLAGGGIFSAFSQWKEE